MHEVINSKLVYSTSREDIPMMFISVVAIIAHGAVIHAWYTNPDIKY